MVPEENRKEQEQRSVDREVVRDIEKFHCQKLWGEVFKLSGAAAWGPLSDAVNIAPSTADFISVLAAWAIEGPTKL